MIRFGVVGTGWRTAFYLRVAAARPDLFEVLGVVSRDPERARAWAEPFGVALHADVPALLAADPDFVVTSVPWEANPGLVAELAEQRVPVLSETPPAPDVEGMSRLFEHVARGARIAVAEQFHLQPHHAARIHVVRTGVLGEVSEAQVSAGHGYHGISLMRRLLDVGLRDATITARRFTSPIVRSPDRTGPPDTDQVVDSEQVLAWFDFGDRLGVFDFTVDQYFSHVRRRRVLVRGVRGEMVDDEVTFLREREPVRLALRRSDAGQQGDLEGHHLRGIQLGHEWVYRNPLAPARLSDEEIAVGACLLGMAEYVAGGDAFYPLAEACQDQYLDLVMARALESGEPVRSAPQVWAGRA